MSMPRFAAPRGLVVVSVAAMLLGALGLAACESYDDGTTRSKSTRTVETPTQKTTTTTTHEKTVRPN